jgi:hypothetical protein
MENNALPFVRSASVLTTLLLVFFKDGAVEPRMMDEKHSSSSTSFGTD